MLLLVFFAMFALCLGLWATGFPLWMVFLAALATWVAFYFVVYPRIRAYKAVTGIDDRLNAVEAGSWEWLRLKLAGFKVLIFAALTSSLPFLADLLQWLQGQNLDFAFDAMKPQWKQGITFAFGAAVFTIPMMMQWLHSRTAASAAAAEPIAEAAGVGAGV